MTLPPRNFAKRNRDKRLVSRSHRTFVRKHLCLAWERKECVGPIDFAHARDVAPRGHGGAKPDDTFGVSLCRLHHRESEKRERAWGEEMGIDVLALALEFALASPDHKVRLAAAEFLRGKADGGEAAE